MLSFYEDIGYYNIFIKKLAILIVHMSTLEIFPFSYDSNYLLELDNIDTKC